MTRESLIKYNITISSFMLAIIWIFGLRENYTLMLAYAMNTAIVFTFLLKVELGNYKGMNLNILVLVGYIFRMVYPALTMSIGAIGGGRYTYLYTNDITDYMFPCVAWMNIYYMLFYFFLNKYASGKTIDNALIFYFRRYNIFILSIILFVLSEAYNIYAYYIPSGNLSLVINTILSNLLFLSLLLLAFDAASSKSRKKSDMFKVLIILAILRAIFFGFYKGAILIPFAIYCLYEFMILKQEGKKVFNKRLVILVIVFFASAQFVVYPFMSIKRNVSGFDVSYGGTGGVATVEFSNLDILSDVLSGKYINDNDQGNTFDRLNSIPSNTFFYKDVCTKQRYNTDIALDNIILLIPRFLYPEKHSTRAGLMVNSYATTGSITNYKYSLSFSNIGQFSSAYFMGGAFLAVLFAILNGLFICRYFEFLLSNILNIVSLLFLTLLLMDALNAFEEISDGGLVRVGMYCFYMIAVKLTNVIFKPKQIIYE